jgi:hypothetical protein
MCSSGLGGCCALDPDITLNIRPHELARFVEPASSHHQEADEVGGGNVRKGIEQGANSFALEIALTGDLPSLPKPRRHDTFEPSEADGVAQNGAHILQGAVCQDRAGDPVENASQVCVAEIRQFQVA